MGIVGRLKPGVSQEQVAATLKAGDEKGILQTEPAATTVIAERDMRFKLASTLPAGDVIRKIVNHGPSAHETILARLHHGATLETFKAYLKQQNPSGPSPADILGLGAIMTGGHTQFAPFHLTTGTYVLLCFVSDKHGVPHVMDGMIKSFEVR